MNTIKLIAACSLLTWAGASFSHESHSKSKAPTIREQTDWGIAGEAKSVTRTITVTMTDQMRFSPDQLKVKQGETLRLVINNSGKLLHELVIDTPAELDKHAALMVKFPNMDHSEPYMAHVAPGKKGELLWTFNRAGNFKFACLVAGHYSAGMTGNIEVSPTP